MHPGGGWGLEGRLRCTPRARAGKGKSPGGAGGFPPSSERVPPRPHGPQRVDVDEAGGVGGLVVPLHVHAAERKAPSLGWEVLEGDGGGGSWGCLLGWERTQVIPEPAASPGPVPAVAPSSVAGGCGGLRAGSPLAPGEEARGRRSSRATGPPRRPSPGPAGDTAPNFPPGSLACSITLLPRALASSRDARPVPEVSPRFGCPMLGRDIAPGRGHCPRQGSGAGGDPRHRWGLWLRRPVPRRNTESIPLLKGGSHPPDPNSNGFLHPQNTRLISQKPQTFKEELGGEIKKEKKKRKSLQ